MTVARASTIAPGRGLIYAGGVAALVTMHGKERVIGPLVSRFLGIDLQLAPGIDTDRFGTFSRDVARTGTPTETARAKIATASDLMPDARVALASEGSFGAHPMNPFLSVGREIVMLVDRAQGLELIGQHATLNTNFSNALVGDVESGFAFAAGIGFPAQGVIVVGCHDGLPAPDVALIKDIATPDQLRAALTKVFGACGFAFVETDMRAHRNPHRMRAIKRATIDLIKCARSPCPVCDRPGFVATQKPAGLPCVLCATPTRLPRADLIRCSGCAYQIERSVALTHADAAQCDVCNP